MSVLQIAMFDVFGSFQEKDLENINEVETMRSKLAKLIDALPEGQADLFSADDQGHF